MKAFSGIHGVTTSILRKANFCRWWMQVTSIAELANERGTRIPGNRLNGRWQSTSKLKFPNITKPPAKWWYWLRWCMRRTFIKHHRPARLHQYILLDKPLGAWYPTERYISYVFYRTESAAYAVADEGYQRYQRIGLTNVFQRDGSTNILPLDCHPISVRISPTKLWTNDDFQFHQQPSQP